MMAPFSSFFSGGRRFSRGRGRPLTGTPLVKSSILAAKPGRSAGRLCAADWALSRCLCRRIRRRGSAGGSKPFRAAATRNRCNPCPSSNWRPERAWLAYSDAGYAGLVELDGGRVGFRDSVGRGYNCTRRCWAWTWILAFCRADLVALQFLDLLLNVENLSVVVAIAVGVDDRLDSRSPFRNSRAGWSYSTRSTMELDVVDRMVPTISLYRAKRAYCCGVASVMSTPRLFSAAFFLSHCFGGARAPPGRASRSQIRAASSSHVSRLRPRETNVHDPRASIPHEH